MFTNEGNMNVMLRNGRHCKNEKESSCVNLGEENRIYPGQSWKMPLSKEIQKKGEQGYIVFGLFDGSDEKSQKFPLSPASKAKTVQTTSRPPSPQPHRYTNREHGFSDASTQFLL